MPSNWNAFYSYKKILTAAVLAVLFGFVFIYVCSNSINKPLSHDEHQFVASGAVLANNGWLPYLDYPYFHTPLLTFIYCALFSSGWPLLLSARIFSCLCMLGTLFGIYYGVSNAFRMGQLPFKRLVALLVVFLLLTTMIVRYSMGYAWNHDIAFLSFLIAFYVLAFGHQSISPVKTFWAGLLLGISCSARLSFAPLMLPFLVFIIYCTHKSKGNIFKNILWFGGGATLPLIPFIYLFWVTPQKTIFGNFIYPLLNTSWYSVIGSERAFSLWEKINYLINDANYIPADASLAGEYALNRLLFIFGGCAIITAIIAIWKNSFLKVIFAFWLGCLPFILLGAFAPTPPQLQYFYPLTFWLALGIGWMAAYWLKVIADMLILKTLIKYAGVGLACLIGVFAYRIATLTPEINMAEGGVGKVMAQACTLKTIATEGAVLTLAPIIPLEAGFDIFPGFVTGPFAWRVSNLLPQKTRAEMGVVSPNELDLLFIDKPPALILTGYEDTYLEKDLVDIANRFAFYSLSMPAINRPNAMCFLSPLLLSPDS